MKKTKLTLSTIIVFVFMAFITAVHSSAHEVNPLKNVDIYTGIFALPIIMFVLIFSLCMVIFTHIVLAIVKSQKINKAMREISFLPNEQTVYQAIDVLENTKGLVKYMVSSAGRSRGVHFEMWRDVFNNVVIPCSYIKPEVKRELREQLVKFNTYGLRNVTATHNPVRTPVQTTAQTPEEAQLAAKNFGIGGEDNVWHNLKVLASQPTCDVYRNVKIDNGTTSSEIDAVIVDENKGVFLIEIKSLGGRRAVDGFKHIAFSDLKYDPSNQIIRHQYDFTSCFSDINLNGKVRNVLVFSWPNGEERRIVDKATFSSMPYDVISIEQLLTYYQTSSSLAITSEERKLIASRMGANSIY